MSGYQRAVRQGDLSSGGEEVSEMAPRPRVMPSWLEPVLAFVNSVDVELGTDELTGPDALSAWLAARDLVPAGVTATAREYRTARELRAGLRDLALLNNNVPIAADALERIHATLRRLPLVAVPAASESSVVFRPATDRPVLAALSTIVAGYAQAEAAGEWHRIRRCPADDCAWVFWDASAQASRRWCTMRVCGNRAKVRAFTARRAERDSDD
jgi:predicted RNA-binding Zn ribbon-like protein